MTIRAPDEISSVDAFTALYTNARILGMGRLTLSAGEAPASPWNAIQIFKTYCPSGYCDYVRGKCMKVNFRKFPDIDATGYDKQYGKGAAEKALKSYRKTKDKSDPKENYDLNGNRCTYFTSFWKQKTPEHQRKDLEGIFSKCARLEEAEKTVQEQIKDESPSVVFEKCKARYGLVYPPFNYIGHGYKPCQEALDHFTMLLQRKGQEDVNVDGLSICRYNRYLPFLQRCRTQNSEVSLSTAIKLLEAQTSKV